jgi:hypothetical protein
MPEDKARKRAVRARMAQTGERYTTAARKLSDAGNPQYQAIVARDPEFAQRDWSLEARVRITGACGAASVDPKATRLFTVGEELVMNQHGRAGRVVGRDSWWTSYDLDGAFIIDADKVEVLEVTAVKAPTHAGAALPAGDVSAMLGPDADGWAALGILVIPGMYDFEIRSRDGELLGLIERGGQGADYDPPHPSEPVTYRAVVREAAEAWPAPPAVKFQGGSSRPTPPGPPRPSGHAGAGLAPARPEGYAQLPCARRTTRTTRARTAPAVALTAATRARTPAVPGATASATTRARAQEAER